MTDKLGSVCDVINNSATVMDSIQYDAYGNITSETNSAERGMYAWTGQQLDVETGLQYNRARWYDSSTGRWISQDPMGFDAGDSNLYRYVNNAPTNTTDPSGDIFITSAANADIASELVRGLRSAGAKFVKLVPVGNLIYIHTDERDRVAIFRYANKRWDIFRTTVNDSNDSVNQTRTRFLLLRVPSEKPLQ